MSDDGNMYDDEPPRRPGHNPNRNELVLGDMLSLNPLGMQICMSVPDGDSDSLPSPPTQPPPMPCRDAGESQIRVNVTDNLRNGKNMLIESPPGIQRDMNILKTLLRYLQSANGVAIGTDGALNPDKAPKPSRIFIGTRNFQEAKVLAAEIRDLAGSQLLENIQCTVLGHRVDYCINEDVRRNYTGRNAINLACRKRIRRPNRNVPSTSKRAREDARDDEGPSCENYWNSNQYPDSVRPFIVNNGNWHQIQDVEDFIDGCRGGQPRCPYYDALHLAETANLIICPVELILSPYFRAEFSINLENAILLIDDAYNLENLCKKEASFKISKDELTRASSILRDIIEDYQKRRHDEIGDDYLWGPLDEIGFTALENFLPAFAQWLPTPDRNGHPDSIDRNDILEEINKLDSAALSIPNLMNALLYYANNSALRIPDADAGVVEMLGKVIFTQKLVVENNNSFGVKLTSEEISPDSNRSRTVLKIICNDPSLVLVPVEVRLTSLIVGANCIAPYSPFITEFGITFHETLKIQYDDAQVQERLYVGYTKTGPNGIKLELDFDARNEPEIMREVGRSLIEICKTIPNGTVALFHSEPYLQELLHFWQNNEIEAGGGTIWEEIGRIKHVFCELDMGTEEETRIQMEDFQLRSKQKENSAILLAYHRGKVYKNWDLKYDSVRTIVHVSIPFGPWKTDDFIIEKRKGFERRFERHSIQNKEWYKREAFRVLNQSFANCMQDGVNDWGVVIVLDSRMPGESPPAEDTFPDWVPRPIRHRNLNLLLEDVAGRIEEYE